MLLFSLLISLLMNHGGQAMPVPQTVALLQRSLASIIWSCFLTLFLCAWMSAHPNIPPAEEYGRRAVWRRAKLMFWTIVAPELVLACAVRQWFAAQEIADTYNELKGLKVEKTSFIMEWLKGHKKPRSKAWTRLHGYFLIMGGFTLTEPESSDYLADDKSTGSSQDVTRWAEGLSADLDALPVSNHDQATASHRDDPNSSLNTSMEQTLAAVDSHPEISRSVQATVEQHRIPGSDDARHAAHPPRLPVVALRMSSRNHAGRGQFEARQSPILDDVEKGRQRNPSRPRARVLTYELLETLLKVKDLDFDISITEEEIDDRSKGDFLVALIPVLQIICFVTHCATRWIQQLDLTQLELFTFAFASVTAVMYGFWFKKPLNVAVPVAVKLKRRLRRNELKIKVERTHGPFQSWNSMTLADAITPLCQSFANSWFKFRSTFRILPTRNMAERLPPHLIISYPLVVFYRLFVVLPVVGVLLAIAIILALGLLVIGGLTILPVYLLLVSLFDIAFTDDVRTDASHVPTFYTPKTKKENSPLLHLFVFASCGVIFGGIQCVGWNLTFPSEVEQIFWRIAVVSMTAASLAGIPTFVVRLIMKRDHRKTVSASGVPWLKRVALGVGLYLLALGVVARLCLIVQTLVLLRQQPESTLRAATVDWITFVSHFL